MMIISQDALGLDGPQQRLVNPAVLFEQQAKLLRLLTFSQVAGFALCQNAPGKMQRVIADVVLKVDGQEVARATVNRTVPAAFSANETFDVGVDLGSVVSLDYFDRRPFRFNGKVEKLEVSLK
jgi:hypothetical protein